MSRLWDYIDEQKQQRKALDALPVTVTNPVCVVTDCKTRAVSGRTVCYRHIPNA